MQTKFILLLIAAPLVITVGNARAEEVSKLTAPLRPFELQLDPGVGYSSYYGLLLGLKSSVGVNIGSHWQWTLGGSFDTATRFNANSYSLFTGPRYFLSEDHARSFFVGAGVGYGDQLWNGQADYHAGFYGYVEAGKRWALNDSGTWSFSPYVSVRTDGHGSSLLIQPLSFTYSF